MTLFKVTTDFDISEYFMCYLKDCNGLFEPDRDTLIEELKGGVRFDLGLKVKFSNTISR